MSGAEHWMDRLQGLAARFPQYGLGQDLAGLAAADLWGRCAIEAVPKRRGRVGRRPRTSPRRRGSCGAGI